MHGRLLPPVQQSTASKYPSSSIICHWPDLIISAYSDIFSASLIRISTSLTGFQTNIMEIRGGWKIIINPPIIIKSVDYMLTELWHVIFQSSTIQTSNDSFSSCYILCHMYTIFDSRKVLKYPRQQQHVAWLDSIHM